MLDPAPAIKNVAIVGAGAMGCLFAAKLVGSGVAVTLIDVDHDRLTALARLGVTLIDDRGSRTAPVRACLAALAQDPVELVIFFTKGMHTRAAAASVVHLARAGAIALTLQNGLGNAELIAEVFLPQRIIIGVTDVPADLVGGTRVASHGTGSIKLGAHVAAGRASAAGVVAALRGAGFDAVEQTDVRCAIWEKVAFNAALNGLAAITGLAVGELDTAPGRRIAAAVIAEVGSVAAAHGIGFDAALVHGKIAHALANHRAHKPSMLQDRLAGRLTEVETIHGGILSAAAQTGVATPVTATLAELLRLMAPREDDGAAAAMPRT